MKRSRDMQANSVVEAEEQKEKVSKTATNTLEVKPIQSLTLRKLDSIRGSKNDVKEQPTLLLNSTRQNGDRVFLWNAKGSGERTYRIEVEVPKVFTESLREFVISCSCPDAFKRKDRRKRLCKHTYACLFSLIDWQTNNAELQKEKAVYKQKQEEHTIHLNRVESIRNQQETQFPGERERILFGLDNYSPEAVVQLLKEKIDCSLENLEILCKLFTPTDMPPMSRESLPCYRCGLRIDPGYQEKSTCKKPHPSSKVEVEELPRRFNGESRFRLHCRRCQKFWIAGVSEYDEKITEGSGACFEGSHSSDKNLVRNEGWPDHNEG